MEGHSQNLVRDIEGALLADVGEARKEAVGLARDITRHGIHTKSGSHEPPHAWAVIVSDETGDEVLSVPLATTRARKSAAAFDLGQRVARLESSLESNLGRGTVVWLIGAAVLAIIVQATVTTVRFAEREDSYQTASAPAEGAMVAVRFAPQASMADVGKFLDDYAASLAGGPQPGNLYRLRIGDAALPPDELTQIADRMAHEKIIAFAAAVR
jgi:hypothetical protein